MLGLNKWSLSLSLSLFLPRCMAYFPIWKLSARVSEVREPEIQQEFIRIANLFDRRERSWEGSSIYQIIFSTSRISRYEALAYFFSGVIYILILWCLQNLIVIFYSWDDFNIIFCREIIKFSVAMFLQNVDTTLMLVKL